MFSTCKKCWPVPLPTSCHPAESHPDLLFTPQAGLVYAVATEDMDALTFGAPRLLRHLMASQSQNLPVAEFELAKALEVGHFVEGGRKRISGCWGVTILWQASRASLMMIFGSYAVCLHKRTS